MNLKYLFVAVPAALCIAGNWTANAGQTTNEAGAIVCVNDKWDEKEVGKGHKLVDAVQRVSSCRMIHRERNLSRTVSESTSTCPTRAGRDQGRAPTTSARTSAMIAGKKVRT
jgi:hypothetical protein